MNVTNVRIFSTSPFSAFVVTTYIDRKSVSYTTGKCKMVFPISYLAYSINYFVYLVYGETYHVCLLITTRTNQSGG